MGGLAIPLAGPLGGDDIPVPGLPWIVNLAPAPGTENVGLLEHVCFTARDIESAINLASTHVVLGYAKVFGNGEEYFDDLARSFRWSLGADPVVGEPDLELTDDGVQITKTESVQQRSIYFTSVDVSSKIYPSIMLAVTLRSDYLIPNVGGNQTGVVFGLEHGPRNTGVYVHLINTGTISLPVYALRVAGPEVNGVPVPNEIIPFTWTGMHTYYLLWNEATQEVELFLDRGTSSQNLYRGAISDFQQYGRAGTVRRGGAGDVTAVYGQDGSANNQATIRHMALAGDVGFPVIGVRLPGNYVTKRQVHGLSRTVGTVDPRRQAPVAWFDPSEDVLPSPDAAAVKQLTKTAFRITKNTYNKTTAIYRDEPGFLRSAPGLTVPDGYLLEAKFFGITSAMIQAATGMGFRIFDGASVFDLALFDDSATRTVGLLRKNGDQIKLASRYLPSTPVDWSSPTTVRMVVDQRRERVDLYGSDLVVPALSMELDRDAFPSGADFGIDRQLPFLAFGHCAPIHTLGSFDLYWLDYCHSYQAWEANLDGDPAGVLAKPQFTKEGVGTATPSTSGLSISCTTGQLLEYSRAAGFDTNRGVVIETAVDIQSYKPGSRTGMYVVIDDGTDAHMLTFVDTPEGKFVCFSLRSNLDEYIEVVGEEGQGAALSKKFDWTGLHTYRFEWRPQEGLYLYADGNRTPLLSVAESLHVGYPISIYDTPTVAFGQFSGEGGVANWRCFRTFCTSGFELATIKNVAKAQLREDLFRAEAIVVAHMTDTDASDPLGLFGVGEYGLSGYGG